MNSERIGTPKTMIIHQKNGSARADVPPMLCVATQYSMSHTAADPAPQGSESMNAELNVNETGSSVESFTITEIIIDSTIVTAGIIMKGPRYRTQSIASADGFRRLADGLMVMQAAVEI